MLLLLLDTETTGLPNDPKVRPIEVGAYLWDSKNDTVVQTFQTLLYHTENPCESINHISVQDMETMEGVSDAEALAPLLSMAARAQFVIAHNAPFDMEMLTRININLDKQWVCSKADISYPGSHKSSRLGHLVYDFGGEIRNAHTSLGDVELLRVLLKNVPDLDEQLATVGLPKIEIKALVTFEQKELAKSKGFSWDGSRKGWFKKVPSEDGDTPIEGLDFGFKVKRA